MAPRKSEPKSETPRATCFLLRSSCTQSYVRRVQQNDGLTRRASIAFLPHQNRLKIYAAGTTRLPPCAHSRRGKGGVVVSTDARASHFALL